MYNYESCDNFSDRELSCLTMLACGMSVDEVAVELSLSEHAVNIYLEMTSKKLQARGVVQAVAVALALDLIPREAVLSAWDPDKG